MAYKFQIGASTLSGSVTLKESATFSSGFSNNEQNITNVGDIAVDSISADANDISISLTDNRADGLSIAESSNVYMNFDTRNGAELINVGKKMQIMDDTKLTFGNSDDASFEYDEDGNDVLLYAGANIRIPDDTKIEFGSGGDAGIEYDENGTDQLRIHAAAAGLAVELPGGTAFSIDSNGNATLAGNLTVQGETTTVDSTTINISSSFTFEGPADDHETVLDSGTPVSDTTIELPQLAVAGTYHIPVLVNDPGSAGAISASVGEINLLDGGTSVGTTALADADGFLHNDNGTMKQTQVVKIAELAFSKISGDATVASNGALTIEADSIQASMLNDDCISGFSNLGGTGVADADEFLFSDDGSLKALTFSNLYGAVFGKVSGDAAVASTGVLTIQANAVEGSMLNNNIVSGLDDIGADIADTDEMIISDNGTIKRMDMSRIKTYVGTPSITSTSGSSGATLAVGINFFNTHGGAITANMPASNTLSDGDIIRVKAGPDCSSTNTLTISRNGSQTFDATLTSLVLESPNAAISLIVVDASNDDIRIM